ncbi:hypothetical protein GCM10020256_64700 [Streptomyces thermocoprophilus]
MSWPPRPRGAGRPEREYEKVAAPKKGRSASAQSKPWRSLALILIAIAALTGGMFWSGNTTPRLGIDLAGGTSITLRAVPEAGQEGAINKTNMDTAVDIMNRRVNGLGVSEAEVQTQGDRNIIVNIPKGTNSKEAREQVGTTAKLYFRPVIATEISEPAAPTPSPSASGGGSPSPSASATGKGDKSDQSDKDKATSSTAPSATATSQGRAVTDALKADPTPSGSASGSPKASATPTPSASGGASGDTPDAKVQAQYAALNCADEKDRATAGKGAKPTDTTVACGQNSQGLWQKYILGPAAVDGTDVKKAQAVFNTQGAARLDRDHGVHRQGRQEVRRHHRQAGPAAVPAEPVRDRPGRRGRLRPVRQPGAHRRQRRDLRQVRPGGGPEPRQHAVVRRPAADLQGGQRHHGDRGPRR